MPNIGSTGGAIPAGGTASQLLKKNSSTDYDVSWSTPVAGGGSAGLWPWVSGRIYTQPGPMGSVTTQALSTAGMYFMPVTIPNACTVDYVKFFLSASSTISGFYAGFYADAPAATSLGPAARFSGYASGSNSASTSLVIPVAAAFTGPTVAWLGMATATSCTLVAYNQAYVPMNIFLGSQAIGSVSPANASGQWAYYTSSSSYSSITTDATSLATSPSGGNTPVVGFHIA